MRNLSRSSKASPLVSVSEDIAFGGVAVLRGMACSTTNDLRQQPYGIRQKYILDLVFRFGVTGC